MHGRRTSVRRGVPRRTRLHACRRAILADFFRHAFDGSGADNFFDAGSCIDGRLTWQDPLYLAVQRDDASDPILVNRQLVLTIRTLI